jgi:dienelactone hydrolase
VGLLGCAVASAQTTQRTESAETVTVRSGALNLRALLWRPAGRGPFPAVLFNHGSGHGVGPESAGHLPPHTFEWQAAALGPVFARHGYVFLYLSRRGAGLSADQGVNSTDRLDKEQAAHGEEARNRLQVQLLDTDELNDALAGLRFLRAAPRPCANVCSARCPALRSHSSLYTPPTTTHSRLETRCPPR